MPASRAFPAHERYQVDGLGMPGSSSCCITSMPRRPARLKAHPLSDVTGGHAESFRRTPSGTGNGGLALCRNSTVVNSRSVSPMFSTLCSKYSPGA
jgi:hypothetical protein